MKSFKVVECERCGCKYDMPNIYPESEIVMKNCPVCRKMDEQVKKMFNL